MKKTTLINGMLLSSSCLFLSPHLWGAMPADLHQTRTENGSHGQLMQVQSMGLEDVDQHVFKDMATKNPHQNDYLITQLKPLFIHYKQEALKAQSYSAIDIERWILNFKMCPHVEKHKRRAEMMAVICRGVELVHKYYPRTTQVCSVLSFLTNNPDQGRLLQVQTGEGKTLITAMTAAAKAFMGYKVDILTSSEVLAEKDYNEQASFYKQMMLAVGILKEEVGSTKLQTYDIFYGAPSQFEAADLREDLNCWDFEKRTLLIDEVDSILIDQLCNRTLLSEPIEGMEQILPLFTFMYTSLQGIIQKESLLNLNKLSITNELHKLTTLALEGKLERVRFSIPSHLKTYVQMYLPIWAQTAYDAFYEQEDVSFINTEDGGILPVDHAHTGMVHTNQVYNRALHQFLEIKHLKTLRPENLTARYTSHVSYISKYGKRIYGLTGTLGDGTTQKFLSNKFSIDCIEVPTYAPKQFKEDDPTVLNSAEEWKRAIFGVVQQTIRQERAGLFIFETIQQLKEFELMLKQHDIKYVQYNRNDLNDKIPEKVETGTIILSTNLGGRGTDIKLSHEVIKNGGLHVCLTFLPFNERVEAQNFGRASRQGQPGTGGLVLNQHDIFNRGLLFENEPPNIATIRERRKDRVYKDLLDKFFIDASRFQVEDGLYIKVSQLVKHLRGGGKNKEAPYTLKEAYLDSIMSELWGLQFGLMTGYKERTEAESLRLLTQHASALELTIGNPEEVKANHFIMLFAQELKISYDTLKADLLSYTLESSRDTKKNLEETFKAYMGDSEELLKTLCQLTETTLVIINPKGTFQIFKGGDRHRIILGRVRSETHTSFSLQNSQDLELFDTPEDDSLIHALAHQMKLNDITLLPKPKEKVSYKELKSFLFPIKTISDSVTALIAPPTTEGIIKTFIQKTGRIVAVAEEKEINSGFTYYLYQGDALIREKHQSLPDKWATHKVLYLVQSNRVREGNKFEKEEDVVIPHFQSVISFANNDRSVLHGIPSVFEVLPAYKHKANKLRSVPPVQGMPKYSILRDATDHLHEIITRKIEQACILEKIPPQRRLEHYSSTLLSVNDSYEKALARYHHDLLAQEYVSIDCVVSNFIENAKALYESGDIILPPSKLNRLVTDNAENLDEAFYQSLGAFPSLSHVIYYIQARYEVNGLRNGYINRAKSMLLSAKEAIIQGMQPWQLIHFYMGFNNSADPQGGNLASDSLLSRQINGRMGFYQGLHHNIINNIEFIKNHKEGDVRCSNEFSKFHELGVSKLDENILRGEGISAFYDIEKIPPEPTFGDLFGMAILGAAQAVGGVLLICTGAGVSIGVTLLTEGLQDAYQAIKSGLTREAIDWVGYWANKGFSFCMCIASAAYGAAKETIGQGFKGFEASFKQGFMGATKEVTQKGIQEAAKKAITETVIRTTGQALANEGMSALIQSIIQTLKKDLEKASQTAMSSLKEDEKFMKKMYQIQAFEAAIENSTQVSVLRTIEHTMQSWVHSNDNIRTSLLVIKKVAEFLRNQHQTGWSKTLSVSAQLAALGYSAHTALTFGNDYVQKFREEVLAAKIPSLENVLTQLTDDKKTSIRWVKKAQETGLIGTTSPYESHSKDLKERLASINMANLLNYKLSDVEAKIVDPHTHKVSIMGDKILENVCAYYENQSEARLDFIEKNLASLWLNDCSQGIVKEFREHAMSAVSGLIAGAAKSISNEIFITSTLRELEQKESRGEILSSDEKDKLAWARRENTLLKVQELESLAENTDDKDLKKSYQDKADSFKSEISRSYSEEAAKIILGEREAFLEAHGISAETLLKKLDEKLQSLEDEGVNPHVIGLWKQMQHQSQTKDCYNLTEKKVKGEALNEEEVKRYEGYLNDPEMRKLRQQMEVDLRSADAKEAGRKAEEAELHAKARAEEEARQREAAAEKRKELLRSKQRVGTLTPDERDELQDMLDRDAAQRAAQPAAGGGAAAAGAGDDGEDRDANEAVEVPEEKNQTWYGDARDWLSEKLSFDLSMPEQDPNFLPWIGTEAFVQLGIDQKIEDGSWSTYTPAEREDYIRNKAEEYRMQLDAVVNLNMLTAIPGALAHGVGKATTWAMKKFGARNAVANDTGQFVTDVGEWIGFGYAGAILKEFKLVGKVVEGMPLKVFRKNVKTTLANGETKIIKKIYQVEYCQIHHILSDKNDLILNNPLLKKAGFDLNDPVNKMLLPTLKGAEKSTTVRTLHQGCHLKEYSEKLAKKMDALHTEGQLAKWSQAQYRAKLETLISETRQQLKYGKIHLNKTTRESKGLPLAGE